MSDSYQAVVSRSFRQRRYLRVPKSNNISEHETILISTGSACRLHRCREGTEPGNGPLRSNCHPGQSPHHGKASDRVCQHSPAFGRFHLPARHLQRQRRELRNPSPCRRAQLSAANLVHRLQDPLPPVPHPRRGALSLGARCRDACRNGGHRRVQDASELARLAASDIDKVELITNPGAEYDATVKAVVRIRTLRGKEDGWGDWCLPTPWGRGR